MEVARLQPAYEDEEFDLGEPDSDIENEVCDELADLFGDEGVPDSDPDDDRPEEEAAGNSHTVTETPASAQLTWLQNIDRPTTTQSSGPGILERLLEKEGKLSGAVAGIVRDAKDALENTRPASSAAPSDTTSLAEVMRKRRRRESQGGATHLTDAQRRKRARNAFAVLGKRSDSQQAHHTYADARFSRMRLRDAYYPQQALSALFEQFTTVNIADIPDKAAEMRSGQIRDAVIFGCLVRKPAKRTAKDGSIYAVWVLSNLPLQTRESPPLMAVNCLVFGNAFEKHHTVPEGAVLALRAPGVLPPRTGGGAPDNGKRSHSQWAGHCLRVNKADAVVVLATAADFGLCEAERGRGVSVSRCGDWFHRGVSSMCHFHTRQKLRRATASARMVINNAERPGAGRDVFAAATAPINVSTDDAPALDSAGGRYREDKRPVDDVQRHRMRRDAATRERLDAVRARKRAGRPSISLPRETIAEAMRRRARAKTTPVTALRAALDQSSRATADPMRRLRSARATLIALGYQLRVDGGLEPPSAERARELGIIVLPLGKAPVQGRSVAVETRPSALGNSRGTAPVSDRQSGSANAKTQTSSNATQVMPARKDGVTSEHERRERDTSVRSKPTQKRTVVTAPACSDNSVGDKCQEAAKKCQAETRKASVKLSEQTSEKVMQNETQAASVDTKRKQTVQSESDGRAGHVEEEIELSDSSDED